MKQPQHIVGQGSADKHATAPPETGAVVFGTRKIQMERSRSQDLNAGPKNGQVIARNDSTNKAAVSSAEGRHKVLRIWKFELKFELYGVQEKSLRTSGQSSSSFFSSRRKMSRL